MFGLIEITAKNSFHKSCSICRGALEDITYIDTDAGNLFYRTMFTCRKCNYTLHTRLEDFNFLMNFRVEPEKRKKPSATEQLAILDFTLKIIDILMPAGIESYLGSAVGPSFLFSDKGKHSSIVMEEVTIRLISLRDRYLKNINPLDERFASISNELAIWLSKRTGEIKFTLKTDAFGFLSNFYELPKPLIIENKKWFTSEHYFQAKKFETTYPELFEKIRCTKSPYSVWQMAKMDKSVRRKDWDKIKDDVMRKGVLEKFIQNADLQNKLIETGDAELIEHTEKDSYWGDGGDGSGKNMLGVILMEVRKILKQNKSKDSSVLNEND